MLIGLIGKANVGKSTFFNAATGLAAETGNYPFTTVKPNIGIGYVRVECVCRSFGIQDNPIHSICVEGNRFIPLKLIDIAGLVPGAHMGKGLGNKFLDEARQADALIHIVDASGSTDNDGRPVQAGTADPGNDIAFVEHEFDLWLSSIVSRDWNKAARTFEGQGMKLEQALNKRLSGLAIPEVQITNALVRSQLSNKKIATWNEADIFNFCRTLRIASKPIVIAANKADMQPSPENILKMEEKGLQVIPCASEAEVVLRRAAIKSVVHYIPGDPSFQVNQNVVLNEEQKKALSIVQSLISKYGSTGVQRVINVACFELLKMIVVYPVEDELNLTDKKGNVLPEAYLLPEGSTAKDLANSVHAELGKGFLYAVDARDKKRLGAEYKLKNNDIIKIVSTTSRG